MARLEPVSFIPHRSTLDLGRILWTPVSHGRVINALPQIFWAGGSPWREANLWLMEQAVNQTFYCFEIERQEPSERYPNPRGFSGVLMKAHTSDPVEFEQFVGEVCTRIRNNLGIFKNIIKSFPKGSIVIAHRSQDQNVRYRKRLISAFKQMKVVLQ